MSPALVKMCSLRPLKVAVVRAGLSLPQILADVGIPPIAADDDELMVPFTAAQKAWERAAAESGQVCFGLHAGTNQPFGACGLLDFVAWGGGTVGDAWRRACRFLPILGGYSRASIATYDGGARIVLQSAPGTSRHSAEQIIALLVARGRGMTAPSWRPASVTFRHPRACPLDEYQRALGVTPTFDDEVCSIAADAAALGAKLANQDREVLVLLESLAERRLARTTGASLVERVRRVIFESGGNAVTLAKVAAALSTPARTLQRQLKQNQTSLSAIVDDVRRELALGYIADRRVGVTEAAYLIGFSDAGAFDRAFKRWTGTTPTRWRGTHGAAASSTSGR